MLHCMHGTGMSGGDLETALQIFLVRPVHRSRNGLGRFATQSENSVAKLGRPLVVPEYNWARPELPKFTSHIGDWTYCEHPLMT